MSLADFVFTFFTSAPTTIVILVLILTATALLVAFRRRRTNARSRTRILVGIFLLLIFSWSFVPASLLFCGSFVKMYETLGDSAVTYVLGLALLTSAVIAIPVTLFVAAKTPKILIARLEALLSDPDEQTKDILVRDSLQLGINNVRLRQLSSGSPLACTFGGRISTIVVSEGLQKLLDREEMETVLAHELAHVRGQDSRVNILLYVYRRILFFDPILRLLESQLHREREFAADEFSAFFTRKPLALASALLKIATHQGPDLGGLTALSVVGLGWNESGPELKERVTRLIQLSDQLSKVPARTRIF